MKAICLHTRGGLETLVGADHQHETIAGKVSQHCIGDEHRCLGSPPGSDHLAYLGQPRLTLALHGQCPPAQARSQGRPEWKALLGRERDGALGLFLHDRHVPATLRDAGCYRVRKRQAIWMRQRVCQCQGLMEASQGLLRVPQGPEDPRDIEAAGNTQIGAHNDATHVEERVCDACAPTTDLSRKAVEAITSALRPLLADVFALYMKTKNFHWHMRGHHFRDYHLLLASVIETWIDNAERRTWFLAEITGDR